MSETRGVRGAVPLLVSAGIVISLCMGIRQSLGLFLQPMGAELGVSATTFGFALAMQNLIWGVTQPFVGAAGDRYGARPVLIGASAIYAIGLLLMALSPRVWLGLGVGGGALIGLGVAGTGFGVLLGAVSAAVPPERRSWAVGLVSGAGSLGTMVIAPFGQAVIDAFTWQTALLCFAGLAVVMGLVGATVRSGPRGPGALAAQEQTVRDALAEAVAHRGYMAMTIAFFACGFQLVFITVHFPKYLAMCGLAPSVGAWSLALIGVFNALGSYSFGALGMRYDKSKLLAGIYLIRTLAIAVFLLLPVSPGTTLVFASVIGFLWLGVAPLVSGLIGGMFGMRHFNMLYGVVFLGHQVGSFAGAWMGGAVLDITGSYGWAWVALIVIGLCAAALQWPMDTRPVRRMAAA